MQRLKNIEDNLHSNDNDGDKGNGKVGTFQIKKDIKDKGIKISDDDEAIREITEHIQNLRHEGIRVNNFDEMGEELRDHIQNLKYEGINVNINNDQVNDLVNKILKDINKRDLASKDSDIKSFFKKYENKPIETRYSSDIFSSDKIDTKEINSALANYDSKEITKDEFLQIYSVFINKFDKFSEVMNKKQPGARGPNQKELLDYEN